MVQKGTGTMVLLSPDVTVVSNNYSSSAGSAVFTTDPRIHLAFSLIDQKTLLLLEPLYKLDEPFTAAYQYRTFKSCVILYTL